jgi:hypothetical protein
MRALFLVAAALGLSACLTSESRYAHVAEKHVARGAKEACCSRIDHPGARRTCEDGLEARCGFVDGGAIVVTSVSRFGHDDGATVTLDVAGPKGRGTCTVQVVNWPRGTLGVQGSACARAP